MTKPVDYSDLYLKYPEHNRYNDSIIIENDTIEVIEQKLEMVLFCNKGDLYGEPDMGCDLEYYLWRTKVGLPIIEKKIVEQINQYIPELNDLGYDIKLRIFEGTIRDILIIDIMINGYDYNFLFN
jgi:hypothetical protein